MVLAAQVWGPEFDHESQYKTLGVVACACREMETGGSLGPEAHGLG